MPRTKRPFDWNRNRWTSDPEEMNRYFELERVVDGELVYLTCRIWNELISVGYGYRFNVWAHLHIAGEEVSNLYQSFARDDQAFRYAAAVIHAAADRYIPRPTR